MPLRNKEKKKKYDSDWIKKKRQGEKGDKVREYHRRYMRKWRESNPGTEKYKTYQERLEYNRNYNKKNHARLAKRKHEYYEEHKEYFMAKALYGTCPHQKEK